MDGLIADDTLGNRGTLGVRDRPTNRCIIYNGPNRLYHVFALYIFLFILRFRRVRGWGTFRNDGRRFFRIRNGAVSK